MKSEILKVGQNGYIQLPNEYIMDLEIRDEVICFFENNQLVIKPHFQEIKTSSRELLEELKSKGFEGEALLNEYKKIRRGEKR